MRQGWVLLDVRPPTEVAKVAIDGAVAVPLFVDDPSWAPPSLVKKAAVAAMGGVWLGGGHMVPNDDFLPAVSAAVPRDARVVVGCQKGLRSLAAAEQLSNAGYTTLAWLNGGFDAAAPGDLPAPRDLR
jgi:rhodanese-related sulfurtransferase